MPPVSTPIRAISGAISVLVLVSGIAGAGFALGGGLFVEGQPIAWSMFGFELVVVVSGVLGLLFAGGRFEEGPAMALACIAGSVLASSVVVWATSRSGHAGVNLAPWLAARAGLACALGVLAVSVVMARDRRAWRMLAKGIVAGVPAAAVVGLVVLPGGMALLRRAMEAGVVVKMGLTVGAFLVAMISLSLSVEWIVRAFEYGRLEDRTRTNG